MGRMTSHILWKNMENKKCSKPPTSVQTMSKTTKQISRFGSGWSWFQHFWPRGWIGGAAHATAPAAGWQGLHSRPPDLRRWRGPRPHRGTSPGLSAESLGVSAKHPPGHGHGAWWGTKNRWWIDGGLTTGRPWQAACHGHFTGIEWEHYGTMMLFLGEGLSSFSSSKLWLFKGYTTHFETRPIKTHVVRWILILSQNITIIIHYLCISTIHALRGSKPPKFFTTPPFFTL